MQYIWFVKRFCILIIAVACLFPFSSIYAQKVGLVLSGGGAKGMLWRQIVADVLGIEMQKVKVDDSSFGTAMLAAIGIGWFNNFAEAAEKCVQIDSISKPNPDNLIIYEELFARYKKTHDALAPIYKN